MAPTAISQFIEQLIRVAAILIVSYLLVNAGFSLYDTGRGVWAGALAGGLAGMAVLGIFIKKSKKRLLVSLPLLSIQELASTGKTLLTHGVAICFSGLLLILFQLVDSLNLYSLLVQSGFGSEDAKSLKGVFDRGQPLIQLGTVAAASLSLALVPAVTAAWIQDNQEILQKKVSTSLKISMTVGLGAAAGLINIIRPANIMLFQTGDGSAVLAVLAVSIFFASIIMTVSGILQGVGEVMSPAKYIMVGVLGKYIGNLLLVPVYGTMGAALSTVMGLFVACLLMLWKLNTAFSILSELRHSFIPLAASAVAMTAVLRVWLFIFDLFGTDGRLFQTAASLTGVVVGGSVYLMVLMRTRLFTDEEIGHIPYGSKLAVFGRRKTG